MQLRKHIGTGFAAARALVAASLLVMVMSLAAACGKNDNVVATAQTRIFDVLEKNGIYERGNLPEDPEPSYDQIKGWFDIIGGAYRHIVNEETNANRGPAEEFEIGRGDSIEFMFDARIFGTGTFESLQTFYTNIDSRISQLKGNNPDFDGWPTDPLRIKVGDDPRILKSLQEALIGCRAGDGDPSNDSQPDGIASDEVRVYLTPDIAFGNKTVYNVPANSTIVFEVTEIKIIR